MNINISDAIKYIGVDDKDIDHQNNKGQSTGLAILLSALCQIRHENLLHNK